MRAKKLEQLATSVVRGTRVHGRFDRAEIGGYIEGGKQVILGVHSLELQADARITAVDSVRIRGAVEDLRVEDGTPVSQGTLDVLREGRSRTILAETCNRYALSKAGNQAPFNHLQSWIMDSSSRASNAPVGSLDTGALRDMDDSTFYRIATS